MSGLLVVPSMQTLDGDQQALDAESARHASPSAFIARVRSRTEFEHLGVVGAARVAREAFPALIEKRDGGAPTLPAGEKLRRFSAANVAQISLPDHERGIIESIEPMALRTRSEQLEPIDLALKNDGASFTPIASQVAVQIPRHLGGGVRAPESGVSLTPANGKGEALGGSEGSVDGASVLYANTQTDTDTLAKPTSVGFELSAILRSEASPHELYYRLGLSSGASLVQHQQHTPVRVVKGGVTIGMVMPPTAVDAAGTPVPVTMTVHEDLLTVNVEDASGEYQYPLQVDPEYVTGKDRSLTGGVWPSERLKEGTNWLRFHSAAFDETKEEEESGAGKTYKRHYSCGSETYWCEQSWYIEPNGGYNAGEFAGLRYRTQGESTIYDVEMWIEGENEPSQTATAVEYRYNEHKGEGEEEGQDSHVTLSEGTHQTRYEDKPLSMTSGYFSNPLETPRNNDVRLIDSTTKHESLYGFWTWIYDAQVSVAQEESKHPEVESTSACPQCGFNTSSATIAEAGGRTNVLYGAGAWLSPYQGAFEATAHDPGIGVSYAGFTGTIGYHPHWLRNEENPKHEASCLGIQCPEIYSDWMTYNSSMPNGEDEAEFFAEDAAELFDDTYAYPRIKVDASKPYNLGFTGMPEEGAEISAVPHTLSVHATDGKKPTPSSGLRSVSVSIDGGTPTELSVSHASCPEGECTVSGEYTLHAENLSEGVHRLAVSAVSNSGEPEAKEYVFDVRHASPISVGPGSVDPTTGQLVLTKSDVSLGGASGVSRSYQSRNLTTGASGPFGPQWAMSVGGGEDLVVLPTGSVSVVSDNGGRTTFSLNSKSEFESPKGDENLKVEYKGTEHKYVLKDQKAGTETVFEQPAGTEDTSPQEANQFGAESSALDRPVSDAIDSSGDIWVTDWVNSRIVKFSPTGALLATYGTYGYEAGEMIKPWGIAINQKTGNVYVTDYGNNRIDEFSFSGSFIKAVGWGVSNGAAEYETCSSTCEAGIAGSGDGQFNALEGVSVDSSGDIWAVDYGNARIEEFNEAGEYELKFGSAGSGAGQFNAPMNTAFADGNMYITDESNNRIDEFSTAGSFIKATGWGVSNGKEELETCTSSCQTGIAGSGNGQFNLPRGLTTDPATGNLYVTEIGGDRVQEITTSGAFVAKFGSGGPGLGQFAQPMGVVVNSSEEIYVTDFENARVQEWGRQTWWPTSAKGSLSKSTTYLYQSVTGSEGTSIEPSEVLSPTPEGVSCGTKTEELKEAKDKGCHALTFKYAAETTAKGEKPSEWGEYKGHLSQVIFHAWNPSAKAMEEKAVAQYSYDKPGRLRAEWDPRIESSTACGKTCSALKTTYGYDAEGHITALTAPGQQPWAFAYGTVSGDPGTGRLLKITRAQPKAGASEEEVKTRLKEEAEPPTKTEAPKFSGTAVVGVKMGVSTGVWGKSPVVYAYQWEDCNAEGKACTPILGATNANYTVASSDVGHTLLAVVTATNGGGSTSASPTTATSVVSTSGTKTEGTSYAPQPGATLEYHVPISGTGLPTLTKEEVEKWGQKDSSEREDNDPVEGTAVFPPDEPQGWPASKYTRAIIDYINSKGLTVNTAAPTGGISTTEYNELNETVRTLDTDNRAAALKEGCKSVSKKECKSAEMAARLDSKTEYSPEGGAIEKTLGPEHTVKLSTGEEVKARAVTHYYYDEGAEEAEAKNHETYNLVTKTISGALLSSGKEEDKRETITSYGGQEDLGWKLRKPTSVTTDPGGLDLTSTTVYSPSTGDVVETQTPGANKETTSELKSFSSYGGSGSGGGQLEKPAGVAVDSSGNVWVVDTGHDRVQEFNSKGEFVREFGAAGKENGEFSDPRGIAIDSKGDVWVADTGNLRLQEFNSKGEFVRVFSTGEYGEPADVAVDGEGHVWTIEEAPLLSGPRVHEFSFEGVSIKTFGSEGKENGKFKEPKGIAVDSKGDVWVADTGNNRVQEFKSTGEFVRVFGKEGSGNGEFKRPVGVAFDSEGDLWVADGGNDRVQRFTSEGSYLSQVGIAGNENGQFNKPEGIATSSGNVWVADTNNNRIQELTGSEFVRKFGGSGSGGGQLEKPAGVAVDSSGNVWVVDTGHDRVQEFNSKGEFVREFGAAGKENGEFSNPRGIAVSSSGDVYVADGGNERVQEFGSKGEFIRKFGSEGAGEGKFGYDGLVGVAVDSEGHVWALDDGESVIEKEVPRAEEFTAEGVFMKQFGKEGKENGQFKEPKGIAVDSKGDVWVSDTGNERVQEFKSSGEFVRVFGAVGTGNGQFEKPIGLAFDSEGDLWVADSANNRVQRFTSEGSYLSQDGTIGNENGQFNKPEGIATSSGNVWVADTNNNRIETWTPEHRFAVDAKTIYYTPGTESRVTACQSHPEWANLPCQTEPAAQPKHAPELPVTKVASYNIWDEAEKTEEKFGTGSKEVIRTKTETYDPAGRAVTSEETASPVTDTALPKSTDEYNAETGAVEKQSTSGGTITSKFSTLGQLVEYKDASGNVAKYVYEEGGDGRLEEVSEGKGEEAKSTETYSYNGTTGFMEKLVDTAAGMSLAQGTFTASYDVEGKMTSETYPNAMTATTTYNSVGQATGLVYEKTADCASKCPEVWFSDSVVASIHGESLQQTSTLAKESSAYDNAGRLLETEEMPAGKGCVVRLYAYEEESNRTSETSREPGTEGKCATTGGTTEHHAYDEANRLTDAGVEYETFGNTTKMPSGDAGGHEIVGTYYVDNQMASEEQNKQLADYTYDPLGRTLETTSENKETKAKTTKVSHYAGAGGALTWTSEGSEKWARNIPGIDGTLCATQEAGKAPVLQLHDLGGNIVGAVEDNETVTKLGSTYNSTEFGVPNEGKTPPKYAWLGAAGVSTETTFGSGVATQGGASYVPQVARALQTAPVVPPGAFPNGSPGTQFTAAPVAAGAIAGAQEIATQFWQKADAERQKAKEEEEAKQLAECRAEGGCGAETGAAGGDPLCYLQIDMGHTWSSTGVEWTYARAWGWCNNKPILGRESVLALCLGMSEENTGITEPAGCMLKSQHGYSFNGSTPEPWATWQLYAHVHVQCESGFQYIGKAEFYAENGHGNSPITLETRPISCQGNRFEELVEGFQTIAEAGTGS